MRDTLSPLRMFIVFLGLLLPTLALIPLGSLWLWQHGYLLYWAAATLACTLIAYIFERMTLGRPAPETPSSPATTTTTAMTKGAAVSEADKLRAQAEAAVDALAKSSSVQTIASWNDLLNSGLETVETVAKVFSPRPQRSDAAFHGARGPHARRESERKAPADFPGHHTFRQPSHHGAILSNLSLARYLRFRRTRLVHLAHSANNKSGNGGDL